MWHEWGFLENPAAIFLEIENPKDPEDFVEILPQNGITRSTHVVWTLLRAQIGQTHWIVNSPGHQTGVGPQSPKEFVPRTRSSAKTYPGAQRYFVWPKSGTSLGAQIVVFLKTKEIK